MTKSDLAALTVVELKALAKKKKISLSAGATKSGMVSALASVMKTVKTIAKASAAPAKRTAAATKLAAKKASTSKPAAKKNAKPAKAAASAKPVAKKRAAVPLKKTAAKKTVAPAGKPAARIGAKPVKSAAVKTPVVKRRALAAATRRATPIREWKMPPGAEEPLMAQERVEESKFYTGPSLQSVAPLSGELPQGYNEEKISILSRDPFVAYAYWEASPARIEREKAWFGWDSKLTVRIYDITGVQFDGRNAIGVFDQEVVDRVGSWYFDFGRPNHSFCADLGLVSPTGRFLTITRSNYITMPRDGVSDVIDEEWMLVDEEFWKLYGYPEGFRRGVSSPEMQEMLKRRREMEMTSPGLFSRDRPKRK